MVRLTCCCVKYATTNGEMNPVVRPIKFTIEYTVPAKLGDKSWAFCRFVCVAAPLKPNEAVISATHAYA